MKDEQVETQDTGQTSQTTEQPKTGLETLVVVTRDPKTGQRQHKEIQVTKAEKDTLAQKGYRFEQEMGFLKNKSQEEAKQMAEEMTRSEMQKFITELQKQQPALKAPTVDDVRDNPGSLIEYVDKIQQHNKDEIMSTVQKKFEEQEKQRLEAEKQKEEDDKLLIAYDAEIKAVLADFPFVPRDVLVNAVAMKHAELDEIREIAEGLQETILSTIDPSKLPDDKKKAYMEKLKTETPPPAGTEGSVVEKKQPVPKSFEALYEEEARKQGWIK